MVSAQDLEMAISDVGTSVTKLGELIGEIGNVELAVAYREYALKGLYAFCQECSLITTGIELEDIP